MANQNLPAKDLLELPIAKRLAEVRAFIKSQLEPDVDYRYIRDKKGNPISQKPTLFRSGAEKLALFFNLRATYEVKELEDWDKGFFKYSVKCYLTNGHTGEVITEGLGIAHSKERKFRSEKVDVFDLPNTLLKIAKKRAFVDAILSATGGSYFFYSGSEEDEDELITKEDIKKLWMKVKKYGIPEKDFRAILKDYGYESTKEIRKKDYSKIVKDVETLKGKYSKSEPTYEEELKGGVDE